MLYDNKSDTGKRAKPKAAPSTLGLGSEQVKGEATCFDDAANRVPRKRLCYKRLFAMKRYYKKCFFKKCYFKKVPYSGNEKVVWVVGVSRHNTSPVSISRIMALRTDRSAAGNILGSVWVYITGTMSGI